MKKAQHEIVGFVIIVVLVTVIGLIFLLLTFGNEEVGRQTSVEVSNLLLSSMYYTTDCAISKVPQYKDIQDLVKECYYHESRNCLNEVSVCNVLENDLRSLISNSLVVHEDAVNKAYKVHIYYSPRDEEIEDEPIRSFEEGNFTGCKTIIAGDHAIPTKPFGSGNIKVDLFVCKN